MPLREFESLATNDVQKRIIRLSFSWDAECVCAYARIEKKEEKKNTIICSIYFGDEVDMGMQAHEMNA